jgi:gluconokinase
VNDLHERSTATIRVVIVMGVSGAGKTTIGRALAESLGWPFHEGDDFHSPANLERMASGHPLTDADRAPWLLAIRQLIDGILQRGARGVVACSALRHRYRKTLTPEGSARDAVRFVDLEVPKEILRHRLSTRTGHFMTQALLDSQLAALERPTRAEIVDGTLAVDDIVREVRRRLEL